MSRLALRVCGVVQGVGFRPFVRRTAERHGLSGWVKNGRDGVRVEVQGNDLDLAQFVHALEAHPPPAARIELLEQRVIEERSEHSFVIEASDRRPTAGERAQLPADLAICAECRADIDSVDNRRYHYAFTNCTQCGPRYTIALGLPYDRERTTMREFTMCASCAAEYADVDDRRHHAQPIACSTCGPQLTMEVDEAVARLRAGAIVGIRGVGGFQLVVDAAKPAAVARLRRLKCRPHQPFAFLFPSLAAVERAAPVTEEEARALTSAAAPIVLLRAEQTSAHLGDSPWLGVMLPATPLHHLLATQMGTPLVCTSGNRHDEPMCVDLEEAERELGAIADVFLSHNRPIVRPIDDSVVRAGRRGVEVLRRARGYAPSVVAQAETQRTLIALGAHLKSTIALVHEQQIILSHHVGDLVSPKSRDLHRTTAFDLCRFFDAVPDQVVCDLHPDYASSLFAEELGLPLLRVQHHHAHVAAVMAEHGLKGPTLGLAWDGIGLGDDDTMWGGEALLCDGATYERVGHLDAFRLYGGERAIRHPKRIADGLVADIFPERLADEQRQRFDELRRAELNAPVCTSIGRLFDAVASFIGLVDEATFEGHAPLMLEACASRCRLSLRPYPFVLADLISAILTDVDKGVERSVIAKRFHLTLVELGVAMARRGDVEQVALAGGCFSNRLLSDGLHQRLGEEGFRVFSGKQVPPGDNGIALGQAWVASCV